MESFCECCGEYTRRRGPFGEWLCALCHEQRDAEIEARERAVAEKFGYDQPQ